MPTLKLLKQLIACPSVTPNDAGCQEILSDRLKPLGFNLEFMHFTDVKNLWARRGTHAPLVVFAGHTDVVPPGPLDQWTSDPFAPREQDGYLYGRGAADMKSGLSAMVLAAEHFLRDHPDHKGSIAFLITSDEEGRSIDGTKRVVAELVNRVEMIDYCIIGEATSNIEVGDQIRVGRRGTLSGRLQIHGKQGHVAFPELAKNPIHLATNVLHQLTTMVWDNGNEFFPPTTFQISNIHAGTGAGNVIPGMLEVAFNFRFSTASTVHDLQKRVIELLEKDGLNFTLEWEHGGDPFLTEKSTLVQATEQAINEVTGLTPILSTGGGTSDGRFIAPTGAEVVELGPCNESVHQANERVKIVELDKLTAIYQRMLEKLLL